MIESCGNRSFSVCVTTNGRKTSSSLSSAAFGFFAGLFIANLFAAAYDVIATQNYGLGAGILNLIGGLAGGAAIFAAGWWKASVGMTALMERT
jgi:hypothetical protein